MDAWTKISYSTYLTNTLIHDLSPIRLLDQIATGQDAGDHTIPALDESVDTVKKVNQSLDDATDDRGCEHNGHTGYRPD